MKGIYTSTHSMGNKEEELESTVQLENYNTKISIVKVLTEEAITCNCIPEVSYFLLLPKISLKSTKRYLTNLQILVQNEERN